MTDFIYINKNKHLSFEEAEKWYSKLSVYTTFKPEIIKVVDNTDDNLLVEKQLDIWSYMNKETYEKEYAQKKLEYHVLKKKNRYCSYLYKKERKENLDMIDKQFENQEFWRFKKLKLYGVHERGGYYAYFWPDLTEVIHLLYYSCQENDFDFDDVERIYVTTEPYVSIACSSKCIKECNGCECYVCIHDRRKAITTCYIYFKKEEKKNVPNHTIKRNFMGIKKRTAK